MSQQSKPVPVPAGFKFGPGAAGVIPATAPVQAEVPEVPQHVAKAKAKKKAATVTPPASVVVPVPVVATAPGVPLLGSKGTTFTVHVPADLAAKIQKPVTGMGGWQRVMLELKQAYLAPDASTGDLGTLTLTPYSLNRLITLAVKHGSGGYQSVIRHIVCLAVAQHATALIGGPVSE